MSWMAEQIQTRPELVLCRSAHDIRQAKKDGKLGIFYHFQGPSPLDISLDRVWYYKQMGVGVMQFAYNTRNPYANGITERVDGGLSILGQRLVKACNEARMIVDVSHTGAKSSFDAISASTEPVIISHGNARGLIDSPRNVNDDLIKAIAATGGFVGAVAFPPFVSKNKRPTMDDMVAMIDYLVELVGVDHVTMGLDYDRSTHGILPEEEVQAQYEMLLESGAWDQSAYPPPPYHYPEGMELPNTLHNLTGALLARGYSKEDLAKIWGGNWLRVIDLVWGDPEAKEIRDQGYSTGHQH
jgi:membrane dipeptidase